MSHIVELKEMIPPSFAPFRRLVEEPNTGEVASLHCCVPHFDVSPALLREAVFKAINDDDFREEVNNIEKRTSSSRYWRPNNTRTFDPVRLDSELVTVSIFELMANLCHMATNEVIRDAGADVQSRVEIAMTLFNEIVSGRYGDFYVDVARFGWLGSHTVPLCSTWFVYDAVQKELWLLMYNNWNF